MLQRSLKILILPLVTSLLTTMTFYGESFLKRNHSQLTPIILVPLMLSFKIYPKRYRKGDFLGPYKPSLKKPRWGMPGFNLFIKFEDVILC